MKEFFQNKKIFITGHTGFKGGWLSVWLSSLGAEVKGYSLKANTHPSFFEVVNIENIIESEINNILDFDKLKSSINQFEPDIIFHLAAQPLVRYSYKNPVETYQTNVIGTLNILEISRKVGSVKAVINVTTDKCYENFESLKGYKESDKLGGHDPYSSSKGCSELLTTAYRKSYYKYLDVGLASVRAGNVLGGGDWSEDRLIPDILKSFDLGEKVTIRNPDAIRPWQHVLDPLSGYLLLAKKLYEYPSKYSQAWNFGPYESDIKTVGWVVESIAKQLDKSNSWKHIKASDELHESQILKLNISKAVENLGWTPSWNIAQVLHKTIEWHNAWKSGNDMHLECLKQIKEFNVANI